MLKLKSAQSNIIAVAAVPAPAETPIIPGSAKGLRITACNKEPAVARQAPTTIATMTRGKRKCNKIFLTVTDPLPNKARTISSKLYPADPILNESRASRARIPKRMPAKPQAPARPVRDGRCIISLTFLLKSHTNDRDRGQFPSLCWLCNFPVKQQFCRSLPL